MGNYQRTGSVMENRLLALEKDMQEIMRNHIPELKAEVSNIATQLKIYGGLIIAGITALIILGLTP